MTGPYTDDISYESQPTPKVEERAITESGPAPAPSIQKPYPAAKLQLDPKVEEELVIWLDNWLTALINAQLPKIVEWSTQEKDYRAKSFGPQQTPFVGACGDVMPVIAMAVDPIHARLDTGIFKSDPVIVLKPLKTSVVDVAPAMERWLQYYQKHKVKLREVFSPRLLELAKHGTTVFKTFYDRDVINVKTYDKSWNVVKQQVTRFSGPNTKGVSLNDFLFPPYFQRLQDCPIVAERMRVSYQDLELAKKQGKIVDCEKIKGQETNQKTEFEEERATSANHADPIFKENLLIEIFELWFRYDIDGDGEPESMVVTYHQPTKTVLQLRYNWYFHQRYPYTVIPYTITNDSLYGLGICEMSKPFQDMLTKWHRMAQDNAYLANTVMFIAQKNSGIEATPKISAGKTFFVDDPSKDFKPFRAGDIYNSSLEERQNLFGLVEKRTGVSDYLTGRESPIVGSRATATSTLALIQEGTRRVEEVLENIRAGTSDIVQQWIDIWMQYGLDGLDDIVFGDDDTASLVKDFFDSMRPENVNGAIGIDLSATDAANNKQVQQQMQLSIIQVMMTYLEKLLSAGAQALQAQQVMPQYTEMVSEVMTAARTMFRDLLTKYDVRNPEAYLPDLATFLNGPQQPPQPVIPPGAGGPPGFTPLPPAGGQLPPMAPTPPGPARPSTPPSPLSVLRGGGLP